MSKDQLRVQFVFLPLPFLTIAVNDSSFFAIQRHHSSFPSLVCYSYFCQPYFYACPPTTITIAPLPFPPYYSHSIGLPFPHQ